MMTTRRHLLKLLASGAAAGTLPCFAPQSAALAAALDSPYRVPYGAALYLPDLIQFPALGELIKGYCQRVTPMSEMKWNMLRPSATTYDFAAADQIANFARRNQLDLHGHTLLWYMANGDWVDKLRGAKETEHIIEDHIQTVVTRYKDVARSWDVVNEPIPDYVTRETDRRRGWYDYAGPNAIAKAFKLAHAADPNALLVLNEYDLEYASARSPMKRKAFRRLVLELLDQGAPIGAIGLQGHMRGNWPIAKHELAAFTSEMRGLGLKILVTELDVLDYEIGGTIAKRDAASLVQIRDFLTAVSADGPLHSITTWGISDQHSWIRWAHPRSDGINNRPLPLDWDYREKPMMALINEFRK